MRLARAFFERDTVAVARALLGCVVVSKAPDGLTAGRIVETEAYRGADDPASHAAMYRTDRVAVMGGAGGIAYVYRSYGVHAMLNVVAKPPAETGAVLVRALAPLVGLDLMRERRSVERETLLCAGPGRLCQALGVTLDCHGTDLVASDRLWLATGAPPAAISVGTRIGISRAVEQPWRFWADGDPNVSAPRRGAPLQLAPDRAPTSSASE
ncbi:MAG TPA: DNA-3-methyladenine glycosylase [Thermomicrobiales bacterium]|jgi:DNA-3-methyladenine glycosylase|nr:DNA-3-methyladenine glycosylase [Thermomicrobiales bacterium]